MRKLFLAFLLICLLPAAGWGATVTVCASGCDQTTIQAAVNAATTAGDIVEVRADSGGGTKTYRELVTMAASGSAGLPITLTKRVGDTVTISGADLVTGFTLDDVTPTDGFEVGDADLSDGDGAYWSTGSKSANATLVGNETTNKYTGTYAAKLNWTAGGAEYAYAYGTISQAVENHVQFKMKVSALTGSATNQAQIRVMAYNSSAWIKVTVVYVDATTYKLNMNFFREGPTEVVLTGTTVLSIGTWYTINVKSLADATVGGGEYWINGASEGSDFTRDTDFANSQPNRAQIGLSGVSAAFTAGTIYFDDYVYSTSAIGLGQANIYNAAVTTQPYQIFLNGTKGTLVANKAAVTSAGKWYWTGNVLSIYSTSAPATAFTAPGVEASARQYCIYASGKNYITIDGVNTTKAAAISATAAHNIYFTGGTNLTLQNLTTDYAWCAGALVAGTTSANLFYNVIAQYNGSDVASAALFIYSSASSGNVISYCTTTYNYGTGISNHGIEANDNGPDGTWIHHNTSSLNGRKGISVTMGKNTIVEHNTVNGNGTLDTTNGDGIRVGAGDYATPWGTGNIVRYNVVSNSVCNGLMFYREISPQAYYNIIYSNGSAGSSGGASNIDFTSFDGGSVYNNTLYNAYKYGILVQTRVGAALIFKNNIIHTSQARTGGIYLFDNAAAYFTSDYNLVYNITNFGIIQTGGGYSLANWRTTTSQDAHSLNVDPLLTNPAGGDFTLQAGSPCRDAGVDVSLTTDYLGNPLVGLPDIGAYEIQSDTTPNAFVFNDVTNASLGSVYTSNQILVSGIDAEAVVTITGGTYSKNGGAYTSDAGTALVNDTFSVRVTSSASYNTAVNVVLTIGGVSDTYTVTTEVEDTTPAGFAFASVANALLSTSYTSNEITVAGINSTAVVTVAGGGTYSKNNGAYTANAGTAVLGDVFRVRGTSSASLSTAVTPTLTIGGVAGIFTITTADHKTPMQGIPGKIWSDGYRYWSDSGSIPNGAFKDSDGKYFKVGGGYFIVQ